MSAGVACFLLEDLRAARYSLRRYAGDGKCSGASGYHDARSEAIEERPEHPGETHTGTNPPEVARADPRWPARCACGYAFVESDSWQVWADVLYRRVDTGAIVTWDAAPAGAVRDARWWDEGAWMVRLPDGSDFMTHNRASNCACKGKPYDPAHRCWTTTGTPPALTVNPSIDTGRWHGWLRAGVLVQA
jgi:hypothetical protein